MSEAGTQQNANDDAPALAGHSFVERFVGALRLDASVYEEVASDPAALAQAAGVVAIAAVARVVGVFSTTTSGAAVLGAMSVFAFWPLSAFLIWTGGNLMKSPGEFGRVLRVVGFAMAPLILVALNLVPNPWFGSAILLITCALLFAALVVGVRQALRTDSAGAAFVCIVAVMMLFLIYGMVAYATSGTGGTS